MPETQVNGIKINYTIDNPGGARGTIVLINGLADDLESWGFQIPALVNAGSLAPSDYSDSGCKIRPRTTLRSGFKNLRGYGLIGRMVVTTIPVFDGNDVVAAQYKKLSYGDIPGGG